MSITKKMKKEENYFMQLRNTIVNNNQKKELLFNTEIINALISNLNTKLRRTSLEIILLFYKSTNKKIKESIKDTPLVEIIANEMKNTKIKNEEYLFNIKALRILVEDDTSLRKKYSFIYEAMLSEGTKAEKEEAILFFTSDNSYQTENIVPLLKSKLGINLISKLINKNWDINLINKNIHLLIKQFKKVNSETKLLILEIMHKTALHIKKEYSDSHEQKKNADYVIGTIYIKFNKLIQNMITLEQDKSFLLLAKVAEDNLEIQQTINYSGLLDKLCSLTVEYSKENKHNASLYYCLYAVTGLSEENRKFIAKNEVLPIIFHSFNSKSLSRVFDISYLSLLYLFRSLTRSICFLRSDLLDYPIIDSCVTALLNFPVIENEEDIYALLEKNAISSYNLTDQLLKLISNLVLDYGNFKSFFYQKKALRRVMELVDLFPVSTLFLFKNFLYDSSLQIKEYFIQESDELFFKRLFDKYFLVVHQVNDKPTEEKSILIVEQTLNLIRNLFCESEITPVLIKYPYITDLLFSYEPMLLSRHDLIKEHYLYILVNMAINKDCRKKIIQKTDFYKVMAVSESRDLRIAVAWLITNLTWKEYEDYGYNVDVLLSCGAYDFLKLCKSDDPLLCEKVRSALENLYK